MATTETKVTRLFGGPGSGKTTALLDHVEEILEEEGVTFRDILVVSYTRAAAQEVRERLAERLGESPRRTAGQRLYDAREGLRAAGPLSKRRHR